MDLTTLLSALATKLGTSVEHLWGVLIQQAFIDGIVTIVQFILVGIATWISYIITKKLLKIINDDPYDKDLWWICIVLYWAILASFIIACFFELPILIAAFFNPEYWALQHLMHMISK
jgi:short subunit fatty acids transporter